MIFARVGATQRRSVINPRHHEADLIRIILVAAPLTITAPANAVYFTYFRWESLPAQIRAAYMAGFYDALISVASDEQDAKAGTHYQLHFEEQNDKRPARRQCSRICFDPS